MILATVCSLDILRNRYGLIALEAVRRDRCTQGYELQQAHDPYSSPEDHIPSARHR